MTKRLGNWMKYWYIIAFVFGCLLIVPNLRAQVEAQLLHKKKHKYIQCLAISPDNQFVATGGGRISDKGKGTLNIWDIQSGDLLYKNKWKFGDIVGLAYSKDGKYLLISFYSGKLVALDTQSQEIHYILDEDIFGAKKIICTSQGQFVYDYVDEFMIRDVETGKKIKAIPFEFYVSAFDASIDGQHLVLSKEIENANFSTILIWDLVNGKEFQKIEGFRGSLTAVAIHKDILAVSGYEERTVLWDLKKNELIRHIGYDSFELRFSPDGNYLLLDHGFTLYLYHTEGDKLAELEHDSGIVDYGMTSDNRYLVSIGYSKYLHIWVLE